MTPECFSLLLKLKSFRILSYLGLPVMYCLLEAVSVYPEKLATKFVDKTEWIKVCPVHVHFSLNLYVVNIQSCDFRLPARVPMCAAACRSF